MTTSGHTIRVTSSTLVAADGPSVDFAGSSNSLSIYNSHVDAPGAIENTATTSTLTCAILSTPAGAVANGCV